MNSDSSNTPISRFQAEAELELVKLIFNVDSPYPWEPSQIEADAYFEELEQAVASDWSTEEIASQSQSFFAQLDQMWVTPSSSPEQVRELHTDLVSRFGSQVPQQVLLSIAEQAQRVLTAKLSLAEQLVQCVNDLLPNWDDDDLQVLARPFAFSMRGSNTDQLEAALRSVRYAAWTDLSGVDQARLSLAIARYAVAQLPAKNSPD
ncbi:MAG TPA: hypothetical protein ACFE0H_16600 [Elainellaceae cyanobacterium]